MNLHQIDNYWRLAPRDSAFKDFQKAVAATMKQFQPFPDPLILETTGAYTWRVHVPFVYISNSGARFTVQEDFETDLASIPRFLQWLPHLHPNGRCRRSAVLHDWLYARPQWNPQNLTRQQADEIFREALQAEGLSRRTATVYYWAVRLFGGRAWRKR